MIDFYALPTSFAVCAGLAWGFSIPYASAEPLTIFEGASPFVAGGFKPLNLNGAALGSSAAYVYKNDTLSFSGLASDDGVVKGSSPGVYAAPMTDAAGDSFAGKYLSTGNTGFINIAFATAEHSLSLLWGSIDPSNEILFLNGDRVVGAVDGADIDSNATGSQGVGGSLYVLIDSAISFNDIEISSGVPSFELAELKTASAEIPVREPASLALLGSGLVGFVGFRRLRQSP